MPVAEAELDIAHLRGWIGRTERAEDTLSPRLVTELRATLDKAASADRPEPLTAHWCLAPPAAPMSGLGPDGHPARGSFLPPVPLPRRMWAGGALEFHDPVRVGDDVARESRIADVTMKHGGTGTLVFVTVEHRYSTSRGLAISERQDIVYRRAAVPGATVSQPTAPSSPREARWRREVRADPVLLFRYSALTFNGHRIHYDRFLRPTVE